MLFRPAPSLLEGLTLQADQCQERGDRHGVAFFIDLIYDLCDWSDGDGALADHFAIPVRHYEEIGAD